MQEDYNWVNDENKRTEVIKFLNQLLNKRNLINLRTFVKNLDNSNAYYVSFTKQNQIRFLITSKYGNLEKYNIKVAYWLMYDLTKPQLKGWIENFIKSLESRSFMNDVTKFITYYN